MESYFTGNGAKWILDKSDCESAKFPGIPGILAKLLAGRGIASPAEAERFLNPKLSHMHDPFLMLNMDKAVDRILKAIQRKESILVYGDYDVDGVAATSILLRFFRSMNVEARYYIPDRIEEGYGISDAAAEIIGRAGYNLMITVDCGITGKTQIGEIQRISRENGAHTDIIVTDHHQYSRDLFPECLAVINPHQPGCPYPFKHLCGAGVVLKLVQAIGMRLGKPDICTEYLDLAALATMADIVGLNDENRVIAKLGIEKMNKSCCTGILALAKSAGVQPGSLDSSGVSYILAPRINAAGRMDNAKLAVALLTTDDGAEAAKIAAELEKLNALRQETQESLFKQAVEMIEADGSYADDRVIVVGGEGWHHGVVGIVASKLTDRYHKPSFVLSIEDETATGSGRSVEGFDLFRSMEAVSALLLKFGGHSQAGGLTMRTRDIDAFRMHINSYATLNLTDSMLESSIHIDCVIGHNDLSLETARQLALLEPCGQGNEVPVLLVRGALVSDVKTVGNGRHLRLKLKLGDAAVDAVYFRMGDLEKCIQAGDRVDIVCSIEINVWQNNEYLRIRILDIRLEEKTAQRNLFLMEAARRFESLDCDDEWLYNGINEKLIASDDIRIVRDDLAAVYRYIMRYDIESAATADIFRHARRLSAESGRNVNYYKFILALFIFDELELVGFSLQSDGRYAVQKRGVSDKVDLDKSELFSYLQETIRKCG
jgi:single-stranded-DNA-specific exonuclease